MLPDTANLPEVSVTTTMRWQPIVLFLPIALLINAAVGPVGWLIWISRY